MLEWILPVSRLISRGPREEVKVVFEEGTLRVGNILHSGSVAGPEYLSTSNLEDETSKQEPTGFTWVPEAADTMLYFGIHRHLPAACHTCKDPVQTRRPTSLTRSKWGGGQTQREAFSLECDFSQDLSLIPQDLCLITHVSCFSQTLWKGLGSGCCKAKLGGVGQERFGTLSTHSPDQAQVSEAISSLDYLYLIHNAS